jgi:hypothetical protein
MRGCATLPWLYTKGTAVIVILERSNTELTFNSLLVPANVAYSSPPPLLVSLSFLLFPTQPESLHFVSATIMAPQLNAAQHKFTLIKVLLNKWFETKLIALEASCS